ncbi:hypothetical protein ASPZODRAFT_292750 [Penicilliopsis zonata CBS 506.65]|uniref:protein kinase C n=1 Tax=Penicilliopsis zonata CBS 506.65 TaxID=1073090 RepID=A0A1L9SUP6_9EURO|nr:hypothetical protein ASPZODRAFT_292750 [Penicilliopsis zonata CBS 506.65]OJJ50940.1 hypothetical protein ASPZODRAFT_292750 [Penicilliopsis zonata CBS 506.65]
MDEDEVIASVYRKIEREKALITAATNMAQSTDNPLVKQGINANIHNGRKNIAYLEEKLQELQLRKSGGGGSPTESRHPASSQSVGPTPTSDYGPGYFSNERGADGSPAGYPQGGAGSMPTGAPFADPRPFAPVPKARPNYSKLDLIKYDTPYLGPKIQLMLSQLEFKLSVEKQYKAGIEKMVRLYQDEGDRKSRADAEGRRIESNQKIQLLKQALKRYEDLHVDIESTDGPDDDSLSAPNMRKPLTGHLSMRVHAVKEVDHAASSRFSRGPETFVIVKVEDAIKARTKATRTDRWQDESFNIDIDKANEIELTVYDKSGDRPTPIGMLWIRITDIAEEMRRKKLETDINASGWVSADKMNHGSLAGGQTSPGASSTGPSQHPAGARPGAPGSTPQGAGAPGGAVVIDSWFALEPVGRIQLSMSFAKQLKDRRPFDIGLNRQGAVRQKKEEVLEKQGHKFVVQQFYNIMRCALCGDFLKYAAGMQCADCKYTCHRKCALKVVTKCISKANYETDPDEEKINHRIPHRFEGFSNISANWCCHCGYLLPFGRKNAKRCTECGLTCHAHCTHLVPDFCGMSMEAANKILETIKTHGKTPSMSSGGSGSTMRPGPQSPHDQSMSFPPKPINTSTWPNSPGDIGQKPPYPPQPTSPQQQHHQPPPQRPQYPDRTSSHNPPNTGEMRSPIQQSPVDSRPLPPQVQHPSIPPYNPGDYREVTKKPAVAPPPPTNAPGPYGGVPQYAAEPVAPPPPHNVAVSPTSPPATLKEEPQQAAKPRIGLDHFNFLAVLGKGNFGKVMLAETKSTRKLYAIKVLKKEFIIENDEVESTKSEKRVFLIANKDRHPFLTYLHACFQTETRVYFVMEYISGGDLMWHIQRGQFGLKRAQFYAAEVCLALKYFHENGVIYRDLKLDNILITLDGHIKIGDYGLCKENMWYGSTTGTFCGTPEFMAPEILLDKKYGRAVDWWAFGVLIYQMLLQQSPFRGEDEDEIYDAILADEPLYPIHMPRDSVSILQKLLTREPEHRLGSGPTDAQEVMSHAFFRNINWDDIYHKRVPPPFMPTITNPTDTSNFDQEFTSVTPVLTPVQSVLSQAMQEEFRGFSYTADFA